MVKYLFLNIVHGLVANILIQYFKGEAQRWFKLAPLS